MFGSKDTDLDKIIGSAVVELLQARQPVSLPMLLSELEKALNQSTCQASRDQYTFAIDYLIKANKKQQEDVQPEAVSNIVNFILRKEETS